MKNAAQNCPNPVWIVCFQEWFVCNYLFDDGWVQSYCQAAMLDRIPSWMILVLNFEHMCHLTGSRCFHICTKCLIVFALKLISLGWCFCSCKINQNPRKHTSWTRIGFVRFCFAAGISRSQRQHLSYSRLCGGPPTKIHSSELRMDGYNACLFAYGQTGAPAASLIWCFRWSRHLPSFIKSSWLKELKG